VKHFEIQDPSFLPHCGCELKLELAKGSAVVLIGENGIGKSTLLNRLALTLNMNERVVVEQKATEYFYDRKVSTLKSFFLSADLKGFDKNAFEKLWLGFGLNAKEDRLLSQLSGGEAQSLKLCLSLCKNTDLYLLDEPSQFLDHERKNFLQQFLMELLQKDKSLLIIEHNREWIPQSFRVQSLKIDNHILKLGE
jgi:energy-coupling factor transporter ATP-binding protein EcfA2